jgi:hypothetical protein
MRSYSWAKPCIGSRFHNDARHTLGRIMLARWQGVWTHHFLDAAGEAELGGIGRAVEEGKQDLWTAHIAEPPYHFASSTYMDL